VNAYPNPFNASTVIMTEAPADGLLTVGIYSIDGREVSRLHDGPIQAGVVRLPWSSTAASGVYFVRSVYRPAGMDVAGGAVTMRLVVLR
jgi:hypothetical protein